MFKWVIDVYDDLMQIVTRVGKREMGIWLDWGVAKFVDDLVVFGV
jgi:hypothetical protein